MASIFCKDISVAGHLDCSGIPMKSNDGGQRQPTASGRSGTTSLLLSLSVHVHHLHRRDFGPIPPASWLTGMLIVFWAFFKDEKRGRLSILGIMDVGISGLRDGFVHQLV